MSGGSCGLSWYCSTSRFGPLFTPWSDNYLTNFTMFSTRIRNIIRTNGNLFQTRKHAQAGPTQLCKTTAVEAVTYVCYSQQFKPFVQTVSGLFIVFSTRIRTIFRSKGNLFQTRKHAQAGPTKLCKTANVGTA